MGHRSLVTILVAFALVSCRGRAITPGVVTFRSAEDFAGAPVAGSRSEADPVGPLGGGAAPGDAFIGPLAPAIDEIDAASLESVAAWAPDSFLEVAPPADSPESIAVRAIAELDSPDLDGVRALLDREESIESKLMAAALLGWGGEIEERNALLIDAFHDLEAELDCRPREVVVPAARTTTPELDIDDESDIETLVPPFTLEQAAFVTSIRGLGDYTKAPVTCFEAGASTLIYGELTGFEETPRSTPASAPRFRRDIAIDFELVDASGNVISAGTILSDPHEADRSATRINFWGRIALPRGSSGEHELVLRAKDRGKKESSTARLGLTILTAR